MKRQPREYKKIFVNTQTAHMAQYTNSKKKKEKKKKTGRRPKQTLLQRQYHRKTSSPLQIIKKCKSKLSCEISSYMNQYSHHQKII